MPLPAWELDSTPRRRRPSLHCAARTALLGLGLSLFVGCAQAQDALPQNPAESLAANTDPGPSATLSSSPAPDTAAPAPPPSREDILRMAAALNPAAGSVTPGASSAAVSSDPQYPYRISLIASRGAADTSLLTSADLLAPHRGKRPVVLLFWMTTCGPCRAELADIEARMAVWKERYDFAFVPVSLDFENRRGAFHARAAAYPWTSYFDIARAFPSVMPGGLNGVPQVFVFDRGGEQVFYRRKYTPGDLEALEAVLARG